MTSPKTRIQKGRQLEDYVAQQIEAKGLGSARRSIGSGSGTREKADIDTDLMILGRNIGFECKNYKNAKVQEWFKQAQKLEKLGREPVVAYKLGGESYGETKVIVYLDTFLDLIRKAKEPKNLQYEYQREDKWIIQNAINALKKLLKLLEK